MALCQAKSGWKVSATLIFMTQRAWLSTELSSQDFIIHRDAGGTLCSVERLHNFCSCLPYFKKHIGELKRDQGRVMRMTEDMKKKPSFERLGLFSL